MQNQSYHHGDLKAELIRMGLKLLDQEGYERFSLRKVAKACNVSQTAPYRHFKDKDQLIAAIAAEATKEFDQSLKQALEKFPDDPKKQLKEMGIAYVNFFVHNPEYLRLLFLSDIKSKMKIDPCLSENHFLDGHPFHTFFNAVKRYKNNSPNETMGEKELMLYCWGLVHGISVLIANRDIPFEGDYAKLVSSIMDSEKFLW
ncbi:MAG: TetR/AcrR family transcriptional regulator [Desulfosporosinus sp.]|nr:TetR/AcrR family transcriptional regulator [Desulfosporosinus sp.]